VKNIRTQNRKAVTLIELMVTLLLASVVIVALGSVLVDSQRGWLAMYSRVNSDVVVDGYAAKRAFRTMVRKASIKACLIGTGNEYVQLYYYDSPSSTGIDRYVKFYLDGSDLKKDVGSLTTDTYIPLAVLSTTIMAGNVTSVVFDVNNTSVQMFLALNNGDEQLKISASAVRHNESF